MVLPHHILCLHVVCGKLQPENKFNQRSEKIQKQTNKQTNKTVKQDKAIIVQSVSKVKSL